MVDIFKLLRKDRPVSLQERRKHNRKPCFIEANYEVQGSWHKGSIRDISKSGAYIRTFPGVTFARGEKIFLVARVRVLREQLKGKIAWVGPYGVGIEFQT